MVYRRVLKMLKQVNTLKDYHFNYQKIEVIDPRVKRFIKMILMNKIKKMVCINTIKRRSKIFLMGLNLFNIFNHFRSKISNGISDIFIKKDFSIVHKKASPCSSM